MRIAIAQITPVSGDIAGNERRILEARDQAQAGGADLLVAPEMAVTGYCIGDQIEELEFLAANRAAAERIASRTDGLAAVFGFIEYDPEHRNEDGRIRKYNAAAVAQHGRIAGIARKSLLPSYRYFDDKRYFSPAPEREPIAIRVGSNDVRLGVSICEDMWDGAYTVKPIPELVSLGADLLVNINASPFYPGKRFVRDDIIRHHVSRSRLPFVYVNTVGIGDNGKNVIPFDGESLVYNARGEVVHIGRQFEQECVMVDLGDANAADTGGARHAVPLPAVAREQELYDGLVFSLREYARVIGFTQAVVPVSGGIDSALALAITAAAFGPQQVSAYNLPSRFNTEATKGIAARLAANFGVPYRTIPIGEIDEVLTRTFEQHAHPVERGVTRQNIHARIRGLLMMAESNDTGRLLISCGNETEVALGYATLYGDMCGGVSLIGDLSKVDVYRVARYVNDRHQREMIPEEAFTIVPSAELCADQRDPFDYDVTAPLVSLMIEHRHSPAAVVAAFKARTLDPGLFPADAAGRTVYDKHDAASFEQLVYDTYVMMKRAVYKRLQGPPIVVVSERAFGFDLRETIINGWTGKP
jgi:NAD+ synthase (glutamine-hydrolysing)